MVINAVKLLFIVAFYTLISCKPFCQCEPVNFPEFECKIVNAQGQNLVFGPQSFYKIDSIKLLKVRNNFLVHNASVTKSYKDSANLIFDFYVPETKTFIYYNQQSSNDSLEINWVDEKQKCCGESFIFHSIKQVKFNGTIVQAQNGVYHLIK